MKSCDNNRFCISKKLLIINYALLIIFSSCSVSHQLSKSADKILLQDSVISTGHIGISIYEPSTNKYWYNYNATKYFIPASNTKLFTCYAGMKYLGDSLVGLKYIEDGNQILIKGAADPTFLHPDFKKQPVYDFLKANSNIFYWDKLLDDRNHFSAWGKGWAWDDYQEEFMAERSEFPIYGNCVRFYLQDDSISVTPHIFYKTGLNEVKNFIRNNQYSIPHISISDIKVFRLFQSNKYYTSISYGNNFQSQNIPFTEKLDSGKHIPIFIQLLRDTLKSVLDFSVLIGNGHGFSVKSIHSQPTDSLLRPMMHRSDNFFAEQTLLMVSNEYLGYMNDEAIIDTLLKTDFKDVPQKPKWVDGSGLSRYNLFSPEDFVYILNKMKNEFGLKRLQVILPTGGEGTLKNYYLKDSGFIYAKTGSLSNNNSLSGYLITKKNKLLIFSILLNNFQGDDAVVKNAIQQFIEAIREKY